MPEKQKVLLDTNFILTCIKQKIDFFENIELMGIQILIPKQVIDELKKIRSSDKRLKNRIDAKVSLNLLKKEKFKKIDLKERYVDKGIKDFARKNPCVLIATLDRALVKGLKNKRLIIKDKKKLEII